MFIGRRNRKSVKRPLDWPRINTVQATLVKKARDLILSLITAKNPRIAHEIEDVGFPASGEFNVPLFHLRLWLHNGQGQLEDRVGDQHLSDMGDIAAQLAESLDADNRLSVARVDRGSSPSILYYSYTLIHPPHLVGNRKRCVW